MLTTEQCPRMSVGTGTFSGEDEMTAVCCTDDVFQECVPHGGSIDAALLTEGVGGGALGAVRMLHWQPATCCIFSCSLLSVIWPIKYYYYYY